MIIDSARLTIALLVLAAILAVAVPTIRNGTIGAVLSAVPHPYLSLAEARAAVERGDGDAALRLGLAEFARSRLEQVDLMIRYGSPETSGQVYGLWGPAPSQDEVQQAYHAAIEAAPQDPAPHLRYAIFLADRVGDLDSSDETAPTLTAEQQELLASIEAQVEAVRALAPDNAAADYLLAWVALVQGDTMRVLREASAALAKGGFSTYQTEVARDWLQLVKHAGLHPSRWSLALMAMQPGNPLKVGSLLRDLARRLQALGDDYRHAGDHGQAIRCYETIIHLGRLMRVHAFSVMDGLLGVAVTAIAAASPDWTPPRGPEPEDEADRALRIATRTSALADYLSANGRSDLAEQYRAEMAAGQRFRDAGREVIAGAVDRVTGQFWKGAAPYGLAVWVLFGTMVIVGALIGLASLLAAWWREPARGAERSYRQWLWCLALGLMGPALGAAVLPWTLGRSDGPDSGNAIGVLLVASAASGVAGWCAAAWVQTMRRRARPPEEQRLGRARSWLRGMRALLAPTLAALVVLSVLGIYPVQRNVARMEQETRQMNLVGEVAYYGLTEQTPESPASAGPEHTRGEVGH